MSSLLSQKLTRLQSILRKEKIDTLVIGNFGHQIADDLLYYLLLKKLEYGVLFIPRTGKPTLYGISFEVPELTRHYPELDIRALNKPISEIVEGNTKGKKVIGYRPTSFPARFFNQIKLHQAKLVEFTEDNLVMGVKFPEEIRYMKKVCELTDLLFTKLIEHWDEFITEADAARFLATEMASRGVEPSFPTIIASGAGAADPHHTTSNKKIARGFCVIDMGIRVNGYCSDMTRTIFVGKPTAKERQLYEIVRSAQEKTTTAVRPGITTNELDQLCRDILGKELSDIFIHRLGHGVGTQVHEWPSVGGKPDTILQPGMIITIEPGVYQSGKYGIRIEDDVLVTEKGSRILTRTTKQLLTM